MFTDRFLSVPSRIYSNKTKELMGKEVLIDTDIKIIPFEISEYYRSFDDDDTTEGTQIFMKNGESLWINIPVNEFENLLNEHMK